MADKLGSTNASPTTQPPKTREVFEVLRQCALDVRKITYTELGKEVGVPAQGPWPQLTAVHTLCVERGLPWLTALVVRKDTGKPGSDWTGTWTNGEPLEWELIWRMSIGQVFAFPAWDRVQY